MSMKKTWPSYQNTAPIQMLWMTAEHEEGIAILLEHSTDPNVVDNCTIVFGVRTPQ